MTSCPQSTTSLLLTSLSLSHNIAGYLSLNDIEAIDALEGLFRFGAAINGESGATKTDAQDIGNEEEEGDGFDLFDSLRVSSLTTTTTLIQPSPPSSPIGSTTPLQPVIVTVTSPARGRRERLGSTTSTHHSVRDPELTGTDDDDDDDDIEKNLPSTPLPTPLLPTSLFPTPPPLPTTTTIQRRSQPTAIILRSIYATIPLSLLLDLFQGTCSTSVLTTHSVLTITGSVVYAGLHAVATNVKAIYEYLSSLTLRDLLNFLQSIRREVTGRVSTAAGRVYDDLLVGKRKVSKALSYAAGTKTARERGEGAILGSVRARSPFKYVNHGKGRRNSLGNLVETGNRLVGLVDNSGWNDEER